MVSPSLESILATLAQSDVELVVVGSRQSTCDPRRTW
jgi:hypothetical protein